MQLYKTGRFYDFEQVLEINRVEGGYDFRDLSRCGVDKEGGCWVIAGHVEANYDCTSGAILGSAILGHYDRGEYDQISEAEFEDRSPAKRITLDTFADTRIIAIN